VARFCRLHCADAPDQTGQVTSHQDSGDEGLGRVVAQRTDVTQPLVEKAGMYAEAFGLRGYDSVQLAAAHNLHELLDLPLTFACYDRWLNQAALLLQLEVLP
jgi:hypothetical protein